MFKNELKMLVVPEKEMYHQVRANYSNHIQFDVLAKNNPVFAMTECGSTRMTCQFEVLL